jgi:hypothetical protein
MVSVLTLSAVDRGFELWSCQAKDYKIGMCKTHNKFGWKIKKINSDFRFFALLKSQIVMQKSERVIVA